jgi:hypothetical protein
MPFWFFWLTQIPPLFFVSSPLSPVSIPPAERRLECLGVGKQALLTLLPISAQPGYVLRAPEETQCPPHYQRHEAFSLSACNFAKRV